MRKAIEIKPDFAGAHHNLSYLLLKLKFFKEGWEKYEWRWMLKETNKSLMSKLKKPRWNNECKGNVLIWGEQGIADEILFLSLVPDFIDKVNKVILKIDQRLIPLFKRSLNQNIDFISKDDSINLTDYDYQLPIGSLPKFIRPKLKSFYTSKRLKLQINKNKFNYFKEIIIDNKYKKYIGVSWKTICNVHPNRAREYSISLEKLISGIYAPDIRFINLQYGDVTKEISHVKSKLGIEVLEINDFDYFNDIDGLASLIKICNEVVSIDNITATLAGALGVSTKVIIPQNNYWKWGLNDKKSYWFPSIKLFRKTMKNEIEKALNDIKKEI